METGVLAELHTPMVKHHRITFKWHCVVKDKFLSPSLCNMVCVCYSLAIFTSCCSLILVYQLRVVFNSGGERKTFLILGPYKIEFTFHSAQDCLLIVSRPSKKIVKLHLFFKICFIEAKKDILVSFILVSYK